jgi:hypothetical protein
MGEAFGWVLGLLALLVVAVVVLGLRWVDRQVKDTDDYWPW